MATSRADAKLVGNYVYTQPNIETGLQRASQKVNEYLAEAQSLYEPYSETGAASLDEYTKLLLGGVDALSSDKNFQAMQNLAEKKVMANRATSGLLRSGATASALDDTLLNFANAYYGNRLNQLGQGVGIGQAGIAGESSILDKFSTNATDLASALANIQMQREGNEATIKAAREQAGATRDAASQTSEAQMTGGLISALGSIVGGFF